MTTIPLRCQPSVLHHREREKTCCEMSLSLYDSSEISCPQLIAVQFYWPAWIAAEYPCAESKPNPFILPRWNGHGLGHFHVIGTTRPWILSLAWQTQPSTFFNQNLSVNVGPPHVLSAPSRERTERNRRGCQSSTHRCITAHERVCLDTVQRDCGISTSRCWYLLVYAWRCVESSQSMSLGGG